MSAFLNRIRKRHKHLKKWANRWPTQAYRLYDRDMPEYRWSVDVYGGDVFLQEYPSNKMDARARRAQRQEVLDALVEVLGVSKARIHERTRERQKGKKQYEKRADSDSKKKVQEGGLNFLVNFDNYIDTGLFLDHRNMRREVAKQVEERGKGTKVLNLFAYTGAFSVWAARAGAHTTTVDMSNTYLDWAKENFAANNISTASHVFQRADILQWLPREARFGRTYDIIVLDPPTFSRSKKMERDFDVQRDHVELIDGCLELLEPSGLLYFSTNFRKFSLDDSFTHMATEISSKTVPKDFRKGIHRAWKLELL